MKLLKKLLPIASVAGVAAVVTPLVTSCGSGMMKFDGKSVYIPDIDPAEPEEKMLRKGGYSEADALKLYFKDLAANPEIFAQDMYHTVSYKLNIMQNASPWQLLGANPEVNGEMKYSNISVNEEDYKLSYDLHFKLNADFAGSQILYLPTLYADNLDLVAHVNNLSYDCAYYGSSSDTTPSWNIYTDGVYDWISWDKDTSIEFHVNGAVSYDGRYGEYIYNFKDKDIFIDNKFDPSYIEAVEAEIAVDIFGEILGGMSGTTSYHLSLIPHYYEP